MDQGGGVAPTQFPANASKDASLIPIPYVAGPSVLAVELLLMSREPDRWPEWLGAVTIA